VFDVPVCLSALLGCFLSLWFLGGIFLAPAEFLQVRKGVSFCSIPLSVTDMLKDL